MSDELSEAIIAQYLTMTPQATRDDVRAMYAIECEAGRAWHRYMLSLDGSADNREKAWKKYAQAHRKEQVASERLIEKITA